MSIPLTLDTEFLVFTANHTQYGVPHEQVVAVMDVPTHTVVPYMPTEMRGIISFQEHSMPLYDLRVCFGERPRAEETHELVQTMGLRKQDHVNLLQKLKDEVLSHQPITVQTDPHKCAFGKWYDQFASDNINFNAYMKRFNDPHQQIHAVAVEAAALLQQGRTDEAQALVQRTETGVLTRLMELFDGIAGQIRQYFLEYAIVLNVEGDAFAMAVDDINFFSRLHHIEPHHPLDARQEERHFVQAIGRFQADGALEERDILLLDVGCIVQPHAVSA